MPNTATEPTSQGNLTSNTGKVQATAMSKGQKKAAAQRSRDRMNWKHWFEDRLTGVLLGLARPLPYKWRISTYGWLGAYVIGPLGGVTPRVKANLALVCPDLPAQEVRRLCRAVPANMARAMAETLSGDDFIAHARRTSTLTGEGLAALDAARDAGRPVVLVTSHLGNYNAGRVVLRERGYPIAALYMPMRNRAFNARYVAAMEKIAPPVFPRNRAGLAAIVKHLRAGGMIGLVADHYMSNGILLDFMGQPARTSLAPAELALKHDALLVPLYGLRNPDGLSFHIEVEAPIPHSDPRTMTRALNDSLARRIRANMDQWMWSHRRWKKNQPNAEEARG